jgi:serine/threonine-protein kinase
MTLTDVFVLPAGTTLQPVMELTEEVRQAIGSAENDFALSRSNSRAHSKVVDAETAALIRQFDRPTTIAQAIARFSRGRSASPECLLEEALPFLRSLIAEQLLVADGSAEASGLQPSLAPDDHVGSWAVVRSIQALEDTEVYQVRGPDGHVGALKIGRPGIHAADRKIAREARILSGLDPIVTPGLLGSGEWEGHPYLVAEWATGAEAQSACDEFRQRNDPESRRQLLHLTRGILEAYAYLHEQGVVHGDIHPRNILIDRNGRAKIIDLGLGRLIAESDRDDGTERGGVSFFFEPEFARASLKGARPPAASLAGEQYSLGAMLYLLLTGSHYLDFSLEKSKMLHQIAGAAMTPFAQHGIDPWPDVEQHLGRTLSKDPAARFPTTRELARAWQSVEVPQPVAQPPAAGDAKLSGVYEDILRACALGGPLMRSEALRPPTTSLNYGSTGVAHALYRIACASEDAELLALADVWSTRSIREIDSEGAFYSRELGITPQTVGRSSLYHSPAGVYAVQALIAQARGDIGLQCAATQAFADTTRQPCASLDVTLGRAGLLLGCVFLLDALRDQNQKGLAGEQKNRLLACGHQIQEQLWQTIDAYAPIGESKELCNLGIAHGWAGLLYASLCWCAAAGQPVPGSLAERMNQLARSAEPVSRGLQWKWILEGAQDQDAGGAMPGWCNGSAGFVFLWTAAHKALGDQQYLEMAEGAAWHAWETRVPIGNLCCGMAGQSYALLNLYRHTGDTTWLRRARDLGGWAAAAVSDARARGGPVTLELRPESLYKGDIGLAVLEADLRRPEQAHMPMFEREPCAAASEASD